MGEPLNLYNPAVPGITLCRALPAALLRPRLRGCHAGNSVFVYSLATVPVRVIDLVSPTTPPPVSTVWMGRCRRRAFDPRWRPTSDLDDPLLLRLLGGSSRCVSCCVSQCDTDADSHGDRTHWAATVEVVAVYRVLIGVVVVVSGAALDRVDRKKPPDRGIVQSDTHQDHVTESVTGTLFAAEPPVSLVRLPDDWSTKFFEVKHLWFGQTGVDCHSNIAVQVG